eukprot:jgi/Tetstr1/437809/TSEL_026449.t1
MAIGKGAVGGLTFARRARPIAGMAQHIGREGGRAGSVADRRRGDRGCGAVLHHPITANCATGHLRGGPRQPRPQQRPGTAAGVVASSWSSCWRASATGALHAYDGAFVAKARAKVLGGAKASWELAWAGSEFASATATRAVSWAVGAAGGRAAILTGTLTVAPESADARQGNPTVLCLVLRGGRLSARLALLAGGGPLSPVWLEIGTAAGVERWEFEKWKEWPAGPRLPGRVTH